MENERVLRGGRAALVGIFGNIALSTFKLIVGLLANSAAVVADALHSFSDVFTSGITWFGIRMAHRPPDKKHPFGHGDIEPIAGLIIAIILVILGFEYARHTLGRLYAPPLPPETFAVYATVVAILLKEAMTRYTYSIADAIRSPALRADAHHHRSDVYTSIVVLVGVFGAVGGFPRLDPLAGFIVSLVIMKMGYSVGKENTLQLMGTVPSPSMQEKIRQFVLSIDRVKLVHRIRIHGLGAYYTIDLHVCVDKAMPLSEAHKIAHEVQTKLVENFPEVSSALVHIEPYDPHHMRSHKK
ncbi:MAG: cation diffusion facilitator family transporter [Candidatus Hydrothermarchaeaceae archaeon]